MKLDRTKVLKRVCAELKASWPKDGVSKLDQETALGLIIRAVVTGIVDEINESEEKPK